MRILVVEDDTVLAAALARALNQAAYAVDLAENGKDADEALMDLMDESGLSYQIVMTKADRLKPAEVAKLRGRLATKLGKRPACHPEIPVTSAVDGAGIADLRQALAAFAA